MPNKQAGTAAKLHKMERELGVRATDDPEGVLAVIATARRLLAEGGELYKGDGWWEKSSKKPTKYSVMGALRAAIDLAHPRDRARAVIASQRAVQAALNEDKTAELGMAHLPDPVITRWESHPDTTLEDALRVMDSAKLRQGKINIATQKAKGRK